MMPTRPVSTRLFAPSHQIAAGVEFPRWNLAAGHRQHAHGLAGKRGVFGLEGGASRGIQRRLARRVEIAVGARQQYVGRALDEHAHPLAIVVEGGHELVCRIEGNFGEARAVLHYRFLIHATLGGQRQQRALGGVADELAVADAGIGTQRRRDEQRQEIGQRLALACADFALAGIALAAHGKAPPLVEQLARGHLVERQRAGLVRADHRG